MTNTVEVTFSFLWDGDTYLATVLTNGEATTVNAITDEEGNVSSKTDWDMIEMVELLAVCLWMDEQATFYLSGETH